MNDQRAIFGKGRVEALSDGLFAIVLTLLVLDLRVPDLEKDVAASKLLDALFALRPTLFAFVLTFALAGAFWLLHHQLFHTVRFVTRPVMLLNLVFLLFVSVLPFTAGLVGHYFLHQPLVLRIYFGDQIAIGSSMLAIWWTCNRSGLLGEGEGSAAATVQVRALILTGAAIVAFIWTYLAPRSTFMAFAWAVIVGRALDLRINRKGRQPSK